MLDLASKALGLKNLDARFLELRRSLGLPWGQDHKLAMAAAIAAMNAPKLSRTSGAPDSSTSP